MAIVVICKQSSSYDSTKFQKSNNAHDFYTNLSLLDKGIVYSIKKLTSASPFNNDHI